MEGDVTKCGVWVLSNSLFKARRWEGRKTLTSRIYLTATIQRWVTAYAHGVHKGCTGSQQQ